MKTQDNATKSKEKTRLIEADPEITDRMVWTAKILRRATVNILNDMKGKSKTNEKHKKQKFQMELLKLKNKMFEIKNSPEPA